MASKIDPKTNPSGEPVKWRPSNIPSTKPFVTIVTTAYEKITSFDTMNFVKTRSLLYTPFHKEARYVNFEIGYCKESKWLEFANDKWTNYANFFVSGYFEAVYTSNEKGSLITYAQIEAKLIDFDARFRHPVSTSESLASSSKSLSRNIFAQKRTKSSDSPRTPKNNPSNIDEADITEITEKQENEIENIESDDDGIQSKKRKLSELCDSEKEEEPKNKSPKGSGKRREERGRPRTRGRQKKN